MKKTECGPRCTNDSNSTIDTRALNIKSTSEHPKDIALLQDVFTYALSYMNQSQTGQYPVIDNLKQQLLAIKRKYQQKGQKM